MPRERARCHGATATEPRPLCHSHRATATEAQSSVPQSTVERVQSTRDSCIPRVQSADSYQATAVEPQCSVPQSTVERVQSTGDFCILRVQSADSYRATATELQSQSHSARCHRAQWREYRVQGIPVSPEYRVQTPIEPQPQSYSRRATVLGATEHSGEGR